jgi:molecular chaperone DnaK
VSVPSVLYLAEDGTVLVGDAAERRAVTDPERVVREFKRRIGDPTPLVVGGRAWAPEDLSARLARWVVDRVAQHEGGPADRIALTHPASWGAHKLDRFRAALAAQGLQVGFLAEPQAAALQYASAERVAAGSTIAVYDLGGGTFDAAVVHKDGHTFSLLGRPEGIERLGGVDFDEVVFEHVRMSLPHAFAGLDDTDPDVLSAVAEVRRECVLAKEALSSDIEVSIPVLTPAGQGSVRLRRVEFEGLIWSRVEESVAALHRAVQSAGLTAPQLDAVLLVGGSSRIPLVGQLVSEQVGRPVAVDADPKNAIALGAALSLAPVGAGAPRVPAQRPSPERGRGGPPPGATEVVRRAAPRPDRYVPPPATDGATAFVGPPAQRGSGPGSMDPSVERRAAVPPGRPMAYPDRPDVTPDDYEYDLTEDPPPGRSPAVLVGIGGAAAAFVVVAAVFLLPGQDPVANDAGRFTPAGAGGPAVATTESATPTTAPDDEDDTKPTTTRRAPQPPVVLTTIPDPTTAPVVTTQPQLTQPVPTTQPQPTTPVGPPPDDDEDPPPVPTTQPVVLPPPAAVGP